MKGNWGSAILLYVVSCVLYVPYGILNRGGAIAGLAVLLLIFVYLPSTSGFCEHSSHSPATSAP